MNTDATAGVDVDVSVGAEVPALPWVVGILLSLAGTLLLFAVLLIVLPLRVLSREPTQRTA